MEVADAFVEACGGREAFEKLKNRVWGGTIEYAPIEQQGTVTFWMADPNLAYTLMELTGTGTFSSGCNGTVAWDRDAKGRARILEGQERALALLTSTMHLELKTRELFKSVENAGADDVNGRPCWKVVMRAHTGPVMTRWYDQETHLLLKAATTTGHVGSERPLELVIGDYREVDGILLPFTTTLRGARSSQTIKVNEIHHNVSIAENRFDLPAEVKAMLERRSRGRAPAGSTGSTTRPANAPATQPS